MQFALQRRKIYNCIPFADTVTDIFNFKPNFLCCFPLNEIAASPLQQSRYCS